MLSMRTLENYQLVAGRTGRTCRYAFLKLFLAALMYERAKTLRCRLIICYTSRTCHQVYIYGKFIAAFLYLLIFLTTLYLGSILMFFFVGESSFNAWQHAKPFFIFGLPTVIATASLSVMIGTLKWIPRKTINVLYMLAHLLLQLQTLSAMLKDSNTLLFALFDYTHNCIRPRRASRIQKPSFNFWSEPPCHSFHAYRLGH